MRLAGIAVAVALLLVAPRSARAWTAASHERIAATAVELMPEGLKQQLVRNHAALLEGARLPDQESDARGHVLHADGSAGTLDREAEEAIERAVAIMRRQGTFAEFARELGRLSHLVADAAFPLNTSASDAREDRYYDDFTAYAAARQAKFPGVFDGYVDFEQGFDPAAYVRSIGVQANRAYPHIVAAYFPDPTGAMRSSRSFDDRGPAFGTAQLSYVHAVSATANLWLWAWKRSRGDLNRTPFLEATGGTSGKDRASNTQRP